MKYSRGFTLIELMIAMTVLSMIMLLGTWSFKVFIERWDGRLGYFAKHVSQAKDLVLLNEIVSGISPYVIRASGDEQYFFELDENRLRAVTQNPIFYNNEFAFFELVVEQTQLGKKYLIYREGNILSLYNSKQQVFEYEKILINDSDSITLSIYGWEQAILKIKAEDPLSSASNFRPTWFSTYSSAASSLMPIKLSIATESGEIVIPIVNDQGQWLNIIKNFRNENA